MSSVLQGIPLTSAITLKYSRIYWFSVLFICNSALTQKLCRKEISGDIRVARLSVCNIRNAKITVFWATLFSICITAPSLITRWHILLLAQVLCLLLKGKGRRGSFCQEQPYLRCFWRCLTSKPGKSPGKAGQSPHRGHVSCLSSDGALTSPASWSKACCFQAMRGSEGGPLVTLVCGAQCLPLSVLVWLRAQLTSQPKQHLVVEGSAVPGAAGALNSQSIGSRPLVCKLPWFMGIAKVFKMTNVDPRFLAPVSYLPLILDMF